MSTEELGSFRILDRARVGARDERRACGVEACGQATADQKLFCVDHLQKLPYVRALTAELSRRMAEVTAAAKRGQTPVRSSSVTHDVAVQVALHGALTVGRLGIAAQIPTRAVESYVRALERDGVVSVLMLGSPRGRLRRIVTLRPTAEALCPAT